VAAPRPQRGRPQVAAPRPQRGRPQVASPRPQRGRPQVAALTSAGGFATSAERQTAGGFATSAERQTAGGFATLPPPACTPLRHRHAAVVWPEPSVCGGLSLLLFLLLGNGQTAPLGTRRSVGASAGRAGGSVALVRGLSKRRWRTDHHRPHHPPPVLDPRRRCSHRRRRHEATLCQPQGTTSQRFPHWQAEPWDALPREPALLLFIGISRQCGLKLLDSPVISGRSVSCTKWVVGRGGSTSLISPRRVVGGMGRARVPDARECELVAWQQRVEGDGMNHHRRPEGAHPQRHPREEEVQQPEEDDLPGKEDGRVEAEPGDEERRDVHRCPEGGRPEYGVPRSQGTASAAAALWPRLSPPPLRSWRSFHLSLYCAILHD
jgi:hypothetical protein